MPFKIKQRGKITYYYEGDDPVLSNLVVEEQPDGDRKLYFSGLTGGYSATGVLGLDTVTFMDPEKEIPLVFQCWEKWAREAGVCQTLAELDFIEIHAFGCQPKSPSPLVDPEGYGKEQERLRTAYRKAYAKYFKEHCPENGLPARFTVHVVDVPDRAASYEFYGVALYQKVLQKNSTQTTNAMAAMLAAALQEQIQTESQSGIQGKVA
ncbi:MAG: hypothetical protein U0350_48140 [Caldilineaceae bacterium]